ncbi:FG-GAP-like repeat-containing protein [Flaviramulus aquimarinus]|uniref:FG-GAP-like repeat-containing protein n=1 Tax=Flaviramulus aquimarinus TaxID=1170456 RepID=UPI0031EE5A21
MKSKRCLLRLLCSLLTVLAFNNLTIAQSFNRIENVSGLGAVEENNGASVADYDGDNDLDIFVVAKSVDIEGVEKSHNKLFRNNNDGTFTDVTEVSGLIGLLGAEETQPTGALNGDKFGASWGDFNNDGFPDMLLSTSNKVQLFLNNGDGTFQNVTTSSGIQEFNNCVNPSTTWFDYNNDGFLDLHITTWGPCESARLYENNKDGTFTNVSEKIPVAEKQNLFTAFPYDFNDDGWMDLYISDDLKNPNPLLINQAGNQFIEDAESYGLGNTGDDMAITIGDYNGDGYFDFYVTNINENILLKNNGDNTYTDIALEKNVRDVDWSWDAKFADFDLDGDDDLFVVNGFDFSSNGAEYNAYFKNLLVEGQDGFEEISENINLRDLTISVSAVDFDYDNDGDIDIYVTNSDRPSYFYENKTLNFNETSSLNWFKVMLQGTQSNRDAIGTQLTLTTTNRTVKRHYTGIGFLGQSLTPVHFGLNDATDILELVIKWPSGLIETYQNLNSNTTIKAIEGQGYEVLNIQPSVKISGCTDPFSCTFNPNAYVDDGSCTYLELKAIAGSTTSGFLKEETYNYPISEGVITRWSITGGEILEGQDTNSVKVKWGIDAVGVISVIEITPNCSSIPVSLEVALNINDIELDKSIARLWNEALLEAIRRDFARPTVHARNLFHTSIAFYDAWAIYDDTARPYLIGNTLHDFSSELLGFVPAESLEISINKAISYAAYRLLNYRFSSSPGYVVSKERFDLIMNQLGYDINYTAIDYETGNAAALGNYIAQEIINYGKNDGSREQSNYDNAYYEPVNNPLAPDFSGNDFMEDPNRWQPLALTSFIDQSGNPIEDDVLDFLNPEWGNVWPFSSTNQDVISYQRDGNDYLVYNDPSAPPYLDTTNNSMSSEAYKWGFSLVSVWGSHLDSNDGVLWDISPKSIGNIDFESFPDNFEDYPQFYNLLEGGDIGIGRTVNPITNTSYEEQMVPRGDYARVLAEFWADGPDSETPPGHWFALLNYVSDHPLSTKKFKGEGESLSPIEWDVKSYFILGGAMHDSAISAWSIKGWYDYIRPISAIRYMADKGQSSDPSASNFHPEGIKLFDGYIETVEENDPLIGFNSQNLGKIKVFSWKGHDYIGNVETDQAGVGWILAEDWWPYQRPSFVTPPFAGYVSGHSTYSRAAAEVLTLLTGSAYFPGGMGEFVARKNEFLVFEEGPSTDVVLQWATYRDASDQCSLSRIWGGIHPPADDIPGRKIGKKVGIDAFNFAVPYFHGKTPNSTNEFSSIIYPNPILSEEVYITNTDFGDSFNVFDISGREINIIEINYNEDTKQTRIKLPAFLASGVYVLRTNKTSKILVIQE